MLIISVACKRKVWCALFSSPSVDSVSGSASDADSGRVTQGQKHHNESGGAGNNTCILFNYQLSKSGGARAPPPPCCPVSFRIGTGRSISTFEICLKVHFISYSLGLNYNTMQQTSLTKLQWLLQQLMLRISAVRLMASLYTMMI